MKRLLLYSLATILIPCFTLWGQLGPTRSNPSLYPRTIGYHTGNRVGISFYDDGQIAGFNTGVDIRGEWPLGSGYDYIGDLIPMIGVEFVNSLDSTKHSVAITRGPRTRQSDEHHPTLRYFWGWNPRPGYRNYSYSSVAMSHLPKSWPLAGWADHPDWKDSDGNPQWDGYFGRGIMNADQESYFVADDQWDDEFNFSGDNVLFKPDTTDTTRHGMGLTMAVRGFQWTHVLAQDAIFWLYDIQNEGTTTYKKSVFGTVVGTLAGGDGDSGDDLGYFDINNSITYSWDNDNVGNKGQKVGYVAYAFLESPGNPYDGIDNDGDSKDPTSPHFGMTDFDSVMYNVGDQVVLINPASYDRSLHTIVGPIDTVYSLGTRFIIIAGVSKFREGNIARYDRDVSIPAASAYDGIDNDLDGLIDENQAVHYKTRMDRGYPTLAYKNYKTGAGIADLLIDEKRDNDAGSLVASWVEAPDGTTALMTHWSGDEDGDWNAATDDLGSDGLGPEDDGYPGQDVDGTEGNGIPDQGEQNFGKTDPDESDQIGLTSFNFFAQTASPDMDNDELLWSRMTPGRFDIIPSIPQDGDFIYSSGYFPMLPKQRERFSVALLFGETYAEVVRAKKIVQEVYNYGYKFTQPPKKPTLRLTTENGHVVLYWDGEKSESSRDFMTKKKDFQGYKIYRATDAGFLDAHVITNGWGVLKFDKAIAQFDLVDGIKEWFPMSPDLMEAMGGTSYYLGEDNGIVHKYIDSTVVPGQRYFYAVCAYDAGSDSLNFYPSENGKYVFINPTGEIITDDNTGYITPGKPPIGYTAASSDTLAKVQPFRGTGSGQVEIIDDRMIRDNNQYKIVFQDSAVQGYTTNWSLLDLIASDTLVITSTNDTIFIPPNDTVTIPTDVELTLNGKSYVPDTNFYIGSYDTLVLHDTLFSGETPIHHGFRVHMLNDTSIVLDSLNSLYENPSSSPPPKFWFHQFIWSNTGVGATYNGIKMPYDYRIEFYPDTLDSHRVRSIADTLYPRTSSNIIPARTANFRIKNLTTDKYIDFVYWKTGLVSTTHNIFFKEVINDTVWRTWRIDVYTDLNAWIQTSGYLYLRTFKPFSKDDVFQFTTHGPSIDNVVAKSQLDLIKVVPNPYVVANELEPALITGKTSGRGERILRFTHVPPGSKISIYSVRGELVSTLRQEDMFVGDVKWNLRTSENLDAAYGVYIYVLEAPNIGTKTGKFALIK
jgi:hypothetical protein